MNLDKIHLQSLIDQLGRNEEIKLTALPDIELYMEQLLTFLNGKLDTFWRTADDKLLTKTMINNYTKHHLLIPPKNKKYTKDHLLSLILIYQLKNVLDLGDIKRLFHPILRDISTPDDDIMPLGDIYSTFLELKQDQYAAFCAGFADNVAQIGTKTAAIEGEENQQLATMFLVVLMLVAQANASKSLALQIIDSYFAAADGDKKVETEKYELSGEPV